MNDAGGKGERQGQVDLQTSPNKREEREKERKRERVIERESLCRRPC